MLTFDEFDVDMNKPASHLVQIVTPLSDFSDNSQSLHSAWPPSFMYLPGLHGSQSDSSALPFLLVTLPGEHLLQRVSLVRPVDELYLPREQF